MPTITIDNKEISSLANLPQSKRKEWLQKLGFSSGSGKGEFTGSSMEQYGNFGLKNAFVSYMLYKDPDRSLLTLSSQPATFVVNSLSIDQRSDPEIQNGENAHDRVQIDLNNKSQFTGYDLTRRDLPYFLKNIYLE